MRFTEIDGKRYEVKACEKCPFRDMGDGGWSAHCTHPLVDSLTHDVAINYDGKIAEECPLREVQEHKPCPFCGSTSLSEVYVDDTGEELEQWMMDEANRESESEGLMGFDSWDEFVHINTEHYIIRCDDCSAMVGSMKDMADTWAKWNRRVEE